MQILFIFLTNLTVFLVGYLIGSFNWSIIFSRLKKKEDIREVGSKNAGSTNAWRTHGVKFALPIFLLDILKSFLAIMMFSLINRYATASPIYENSLQFIIPQIAGMGVIIGHIWPIFFKFKGGKGAASLLGALLTFNIILLIVGFILFFLVVKITKYVSLGSIAVPFVLIALAFIPWMTYGILGYFNWWTMDEKYINFYWISPLILLISHFFVVFAHRGNVKRLLNGTERKTSSSKK